MAMESKEFCAEDPSTGEVIWRGKSASSGEIDRACFLAYDAYTIFSDAKFQDRLDLVRAFEAKLKSAKEELVDAIARSTGKPVWESATEVDSMIAKIPISIEAFEKRIVDTRRDLPGGIIGETVFRPHGTCAVIGPFNFPGHLPNGHIIPALLAGNSVVYKPSELTPLVADIYVRLWRELGGKSQELLQVVHGGADVGAELIRKSHIKAVFFTGSERGGIAISKALVDRPGVIQALEMGGNNPLIVDRVDDVRAAAIATVQSAFISAGQRCSCARRLILVGEQREFMEELLRLTDSIRIGAPQDNPAPFMGPVISINAADKLIEQWSQLVATGGEVLRPLKSVGPRNNFLSPAIFELRPIPITNDPSRRICSWIDEEMFGPILQVFRTTSLRDAMGLASMTRFGLCAGLLSDDVESWNQFRTSMSAGVLSWNRPTTGASSALPFGGLGNSGNGRPSAYFAADYCSHPVAIMRSDKVTMPATLPPGLS